MSNSYSAKQRPSTLFFGMLGNFSLPALTALLESSIEVCAVVLPTTPVLGRATPALRLVEQPVFARRALPLAHTSQQASSHVSIAHLAWSRQIPVWEVSRLADPLTLATLAAYEPDILSVACFSQRIPRSIIALPCLGCINVHPSLLPKNRGPVPLFWTFRNGDSSTGVTVHVLDEGMDSGAILAQQATTIPDGSSYAALEAQCATLGGALLAQTVWNLYKGNAIPQPQDEAASSYYSFPADQDFVVPAQEWEARHVYNFIRGVGHWEQPIQVLTDQGIVAVRDAISYRHETSNDHEDGIAVQIPQSIMGSRTRVIACKRGTVVIVEE